MELHCERLKKELDILKDEHDILRKELGRLAQEKEMYVTSKYESVSL